MAEGQRMTTAELVAKVMAGEHGDFVREAVALIAHELMEAEISAEVGAELHEVSPERITHRNGYRPRPWETRVGEIELLIPRKRQGPAYFPSFLEPRRRSEQSRRHPLRSSCGRASRCHASTRGSDRTPLSPLSCHRSVCSRCSASNDSAQFDPSATVKSIRPTRMARLR